MANLCGRKRLAPVRTTIANFIQDTRRKVSLFASGNPGEEPDYRPVRPDPEIPGPRHPDPKLPDPGDPPHMPSPITDPPPSEPGPTPAIQPPVKWY